MCSNGHGWYFLRIHQCNFSLLHVHPPTNPPKLTLKNDVICYEKHAL